MDLPERLFFPWNGGGLKNRLARFLAQRKRSTMLENRIILDTCQGTLQVDGQDRMGDFQAPKWIFKGIYHWTGILCEWFDHYIYIIDSDGLLEDGQVRPDDSMSRYSSATGGRKGRTERLPVEGPVHPDDSMSGYSSATGAGEDGTERLPVDGPVRTLQKEHISARPSIY
jgi:hypothetical protein